MSQTISQLQLALPGYDERQAYYGVNPPPTERMWNPPRDRVPAQQMTSVGPPLISAPLGVASQAADRGGAPVPTDPTTETLGSLSKHNAALHQQAMESEQSMAAATAAAVAAQRNAAAAAAMAASQQPAPDAIVSLAGGSRSHQSGEPDMLFWVGLVLALIVAEYFLNRRVNTAD